MTSWNALGGAENPFSFVVMSSNTKSFLKGGNKYLFERNMSNARDLVNNGVINKSFTDSNGEHVDLSKLTGKSLDMALVQYEQTEVQKYISSYESKVGADKMSGIISEVNDLFSGTLGTIASPKEVRKVMNEHFNGGKSFNFKSYDDRVKLGQEMVNKLYNK